MSTSAVDLLQLAALLAEGNDEASWRGAVSRAYYASYHGCRAWHIARPQPGSTAGPSGGVHQTLINQLKNGAPEWPTQQRLLSRSLSYQLAALLANRKIADYVIADNVSQALALAECANARRLFSRL